MIFFTTYKTYQKYNISNDISGPTAWYIMFYIYISIKYYKNQNAIKYEIIIKRFYNEKKLYNGFSYSIIRSILCGSIGMLFF